MYYNTGANRIDRANCIDSANTTSRADSADTTSRADSADSRIHAATLGVFAYVLFASGDAGLAGVVAGVVAGVSAGLVGLAVLAFLMFIRRRRERLSVVTQCGTICQPCYLCRRANGIGGSWMQIVTGTGPVGGVPGPVGGVPGGGGSVPGGGGGGGMVGGPNVVPFSNIRFKGPTGRMVTHAGKQAIMATYAANRRGGGSSDLRCSLTYGNLFPATQLWFGFKWYVADNFPWDAGQVSKAGGKILGLRIGDGDASGGDYSTTGASFRVTWSWTGGVGPYMYPQLRRNSSGQAVSQQEMDQSGEVWTTAGGQIAKGLHLFHPPHRDKQNPGAWALRVAKGRWNDISIFCKLNTPGQQDGIMKITVNGVSRVLTTFRYRYDNALINDININTFFGGGDNSYAPPQETYSYYSDFRFSPTDPYPNI